MIFRIGLLGCAVFSSVNAPLSWAQAPADHPEARAEIAEFFQDYEKATADESPDSITALYDFETMSEEIIAQAGVDIPRGLRERMASSLKRQVGQQLKIFGGTWYRHKVVSIKFYGEEDQAEVFVRGWNDNQETSRDIFWVHRKNGAWRIYDFMDLSISLACTKLGALGLRQGMSGDVSADSMGALKSLLTAVASVGQDDLEGATEAMRQMKGKPVPTFVDSTRWFFDAAISIADSPTLTLEHLDKATAFQPDMPMADYMRSAAYNMIGRHELAAQYARRYIKQFGDDADAYQELAKALCELGHPAEAVVELRKALADTPNSLINVESMGLMLPKNGKAELAQYFEKLRDRSDSFQYLADSFEMEEDGEALHVLVKSMEKTNPGEPLLDYYRAVVMSTRGQYKAAMKHLAAVLKKLDEDDENFELYQRSYLTQSINADAVLKAYQSSNDRQQFATDAFDSAVDREQYDRVMAMIDLHMKEFPTDPEAQLMAGDLLFYQDKFAKADEHYERGLSLEIEDQELRDELIYSRALVWSKMGKALAAYQQMKPQTDIFDHLVRILRETGDDETLERLLEQRRKDAPDSLALKLAVASSQFDREDYQGVVKLLSESSEDKVKPPADGATAIGYFLSTDELMVRSLIRLGRMEEAMKAAENCIGDRESAFYQALVYAVRGDRAAFDTAYQLCQQEHEYSEFDFIYDDDFPEGFASLTQNSTPDNDELRSLAVLLSEPLEIDTQSIVHAASCLDIQLFEEEYTDVSIDDDQWVCRLTDSACLLSTQGFRLFVRIENGPYLGDAAILAEENLAEENLADENEGLKEGILKHRAWLHVDVDVWPSAEKDDEETNPIPNRAQQLVGAMAMQLAGDTATIVADRDSGEMRQTTAGVIEALKSENPLTAFAPDAPQNDGQ